jgi:hypothetical protein
MKVKVFFTSIFTLLVSLSMGLTGASAAPSGCGGNYAVCSFTTGGAYDTHVVTTTYKRDININVSNVDIYTTLAVRVINASTGVSTPFKALIRSGNTYNAKFTDMKVGTFYVEIKYTSYIGPVSGTVVAWSY